MRLRAVVVPAGMLLVVLAIATFGRPGRAGAAAQPRSDDSDPGRIFLSDCATCHGADGRGTDRGPTLVGVGRASVDYELTTGRMPLVEAPGRNPETGRLQPLPGVQLPDPEAKTERHNPAYPPDVIGKLQDYLAVVTGGGPDIPAVHPGSASVARGGEVFRLQCAACHAWAGDGGALLHREAPALHRADDTQIAEAVRVGPGTMPGFGTAAIPDHDLDSLVGYVRYLGHPKDRGGQGLWHLGPVAEGGVAWIIGMTVLLAACRWIGERG